MMAFELPRVGKRFEPDHNMIYDEYDYGHVLDTVSRGIKRVKLSTSDEEESNELYDNPSMNESMGVDSHYNRDSYYPLDSPNKNMYINDEDEEDSYEEAVPLGEEDKYLLEINPAVLKHFQKDNCIFNERFRKYNEPATASDSKALILYRPQNLLTSPLRQESYVEEIFDEDEYSENECSMDIE